MATHLRRAALLLTAIASAAQADSTNFRPYLVGSRAAGMGGAATALADDGSGSYYNPGGLAFAERSSVSLSGSVYGLVRGSYADIIQQGQDFNYSALNVFPVTTALIRKLSSADVLHFEVLVPDALHIDEHQSILAATNAFGYTVDSQTLWIGGGYARRLGRLGIGFAAYGLLGTETTQLDLNVVNSTDSGRFAAITAREDLTTLGFVFAFGARLDATEQLHLGLSIYTPAVGFGSRKEFVRVLLGRDVGAPGNPPSSQVNANNNLSATPANPLRVQLGAAFNSGPLTLAADLIYLGPRDLIDNPEQSAVGFDRHLVRKGVLNGSIGIEYLAAERYPIRAGFFTDFAASQSPDDIGTGARPVNTLHVNRYGLSASGGLRTEHVQTDVGVNVSYGTGTEFLPVNLDFNNIKATAATQIYAYVFLATSYEF